MKFPESRAWALLFARWVLGLIFGMAGWWKTFTLGPVAHAKGMFVTGFSETWIPSAALWGLGLSIPVVELIAGAMLCLGLRVRDSCIVLGVVLVIVTYGHLLQDPLYDTTAHIFPRTVLLLFVLMLSEQYDTLTLGRWWRARQTG